MNDLLKNRKLLYGIILSAFGVIMIANLNNPIGVVILGIGALYLIFGMRDFKKQKDAEK
jgi:hypothetical protein